MFYRVIQEPGMVNNDENAILTIFMMASENSFYVYKLSNYSVENRKLRLKFNNVHYYHM